MILVKNYEAHMKYRLLHISLIFFIFTLINQGAYAMKLTSSAFTNGGVLPALYTCTGKSISPPLEWQEVPAKTKSLALIYDDPDAPSGTWTHWVLYNLPPTTNSLEENVSILPAGTKVGANSWPQTKYGAPCPPSGEHRYIFHLYALDTMLDLSGIVTSEKLRQAMQGHILETATLMGRYTKIKS
jgi:Raf kinase inhibitor-like YbhB/YbcL family protein